MNNDTFMNLKNRNIRAKELELLGYKVRKYTHKNQLLHPMYVDDYPHPVADEDRGLGNAIYKTHFSTLYCIDIISFPSDQQ